MNKYLWGILVFISLTASTSFSQTKYWQLGVGSYGSYGTELDSARGDWMLIIGESPENLNRYLEINPDQKYVVQLWPGYHLGKVRVLDGTGSSSDMATFLDYYFDEEVKKKIKENIQKQVHRFTKSLSRPENLAGFVLMEELPSFWADSLKFIELKKDIEYYAPKISAERKEDFVWDAKTREWLADIYVKTLEDLHQIIKKAAPDKLVFYWPRTGYLGIDNEGNLEHSFPTNNLKINLNKIIKPTGADGIVAVFTSPHAFEKKYLRIIKKRAWPFFSQLSHPAYMRTGGTWVEAVEAVKVTMPENLGYFLFCQGSGCAEGPEHLLDQDVLQDKKTGYYKDPMDSVYVPLHWRRFLNKEGIGLNVVQKYFTPKLTAYAIVTPEPRESFSLKVSVQNPRHSEFFLNPEEAVVKKLVIEVTLPKGIVFAEPLKKITGPIQPGQFITVSWKGKLPGQFKEKLPEPIIITAQFDEDPPSAVKVKSLILVNSEE